MRTLLLATTLLAAACVKPGEAPAPAVEAAAPAAKPSVYGRVTEGPTVTPSAVLADVEKFSGQAVRVEGQATAVCQKAGCWMDVADEKSSLRIKVRDGEVVFPISAKGRRVIVEGTVRLIPADPSKDPAACGGKHPEGEHHDCARPAGATARLDGFGATVFEGA